MNRIVGGERGRGAKRNARRVLTTTFSSLALSSGSEIGPNFYRVVTGQFAQDSPRDSASVREHASRATYDRDITCVGELARADTSGNIGATFGTLEGGRGTVGG